MIFDNTSRRIARAVGACYVRDEFNTFQKS